MERDHDAVREYEENTGAEYAYPEGYDANSYLNYYQQGEDYYQQEGYEGYYSQQAGGQATTDPYEYQYSYDPNYDAYAATEGQDHSYYNTEGYGAEMPNYNTQEGQQLYLDQLTSEQTTGYYYDDQGNLINEYEGAESPTSVFNQEAYWENQENDTQERDDESPQDKVESEGLAPSESVPTNSVVTPEGDSSPKTSKGSKTERTSSPSRKKKKKTKQERIAERQAALEKEEEERLKKEEELAATSSDNNKTGEAAKPAKLSKKKTGFVDREKAKFQMKLRIAKAIKRSRMPVQICILPTTRKHLSPMDKYFGSKSVECVLSDIFWASMKGDIGRVQHLVEVEGESATDSKLDPWNLHQTPLHWAAKGGSVRVITYLLAAGASPRSLDDNGSLPLHLSCWAGHVDASILLLRSSDVKDLYVQDYDGALCPLDWANVRGHSKLLKAIEKYQDSLWLPKFVDELVRGIVRYKIKIFKEPPKKPLVKDTPADAKADPAAAPTDKDEDKPAGKPVEGIADDKASPKDKKSLLKRAKTGKMDRKLDKPDKASSKSLQ